MCHVLDAAPCRVLRKEEGASLDRYEVCLLTLRVCLHCICLHRQCAQFTAAHTDLKN